MGLMVASENRALLEFHILDQNEITLLDIDCEVKTDIVLTDFLEIIFVNYNFRPEGIKSIYLFKATPDEPVRLNDSLCDNTLENLGITNGTIIRLVYKGND